MIQLIIVLLVICSHEIKANSITRKILYTSNSKHSDHEGYIIITNAIIPGFISDAMDNDFTNNQEECKALCLKNKKCDIWSFDRNNKRCIMRKDEGFNLVYNEYHDSGIKKERKEKYIVIESISYSINRDIGLTFKDYKVIGKDLANNNYANSTWAQHKVGNSEECQLACFYEYNCVAWSFSISTFQCNLKERYDKVMEEDDDMISGLIQAYDDSNLDFIVYYEYGFNKEDQKLRSLKNDDYSEKKYGYKQRVSARTSPTCKVNKNTHCTGLIKLFGPLFVSNAKKCCEKCRNDDYCTTWRYKNGNCFGYIDKKQCTYHKGYESGSFL